MTDCAPLFPAYVNGMSQNNCFDEMWGHGQTQSMGQGPAQTQYQGLRSPYAPFDAWFQNEDPARLRDAP